MLPADFAGFNLGVQQRRQLGFGAARDTCKKRRMIEADAAEGKLVLACQCHSSLRENKIALTVMLWVIHQHQVGKIPTFRHAARLGQQRFKIKLAIDICVDHQERLIPQQWQCIGDSPRGLQRFLFRRICNVHPEARAICQRGFD